MNPLDEALATVQVSDCSREQEEGHVPHWPDDPCRWNKTMSERNLEQALAHAEKCRDALNDPQAGARNYYIDLVLLADEALRLRELNEKGEKVLDQCAMENTGLRQCHNIQVEEIRKLKAEIDGLKSGPTLTEKDLGSYGE